jgi:pyruvate dehydrogenase E2 component (dihydrolipoamide acetyltransferase)
LTVEGRLSKPTAMRAAIARRMTKSKQEAPHFYVSTEVRLDPVHALIAAEIERQPAERITTTVALVRAAAAALCDEPRLNSVWTDDGLLEADEINVGVAIALDGGLIAPALLGVDRMDFRATAQALNDLVARARAQKLKPAELTEATFTLSNLGMFEISAFTAIVTPPQVAILATGRAVRRLVPSEGGFEVASIMTATMSADHRAVDGADAARFLQAFKRALEAPERLLTAINRSEVAVS